MPQVFLGVGHGRKPDGTFDPGAQAPGRNEYELNWRVRIATLLNQRLGLHIRHGDGLLPRGDLSFLKATHMPAIIPEVSFVDNHTDQQISGRLAGHWATDPQYAVKIARVANQVTGAA